MARATLTISSKNYSSWSLRGWLLCKMAGIEFDEKPVDLDDPENRQEFFGLSIEEKKAQQLALVDFDIERRLSLAQFLRLTGQDELL